VITKTNPKVQIVENPGVGDYEFKSVFEVKPVSQKSAYPAVFGSSSKREPSQTQPNSAVPGPGSYNVGAKFKKPLKFISRPAP
jgi:hypothetical protein